jgi:hypothetical protein
MAARAMLTVDDSLWFADDRLPLALRLTPPTAYRACDKYRCAYHSPWIQ